MGFFRGGGQEHQEPPLFQQVVLTFHTTKQDEKS